MEKPVFLNPARSAGAREGANVFVDFRNFSHLFLLTSLVYAAFVIFSVSSFFVPGLETLSNYRVFILVTIFAFFLLVYFIEVNFFSHSRMLSDPRKIRIRSRLRLALLAITVLLSATYLCTMFSFQLALLRDIIDFRAMALSVFSVSFLGIFGVKQIALRERFAISCSYDSFGQEALQRRFKFSLALLFLVPAGILSTYLHQRLLTAPDIRLLLLSLVGASMIGLWSVYRDINLLIMIIGKVKSLAKQQYREKISTEATPEIRELVNSFNLIISDLQEKMLELEDAKNRIKSLVGRIGSAITSTSSVDELLNLMLEISADALKADECYLYTVDPARKMAKWQMFARGEQDSRDVAKTELKMQALVKTAASIREDYFTAVPLRRKNAAAMGVLGIKRNHGTASFQNEDRELLQNIANQTAMAIEVSQLQAGAERVYFEIISTLAMAIEAKDPYTRGHSQKTAKIAAAIAEKLGAAPEEIQNIRDVALLHDIGKVGIPDNILNKTSPLTGAEYDIVKEHPLMGERILRPIQSLQSLLPGVRGHHERPDGKGYPDGLKEPAICFAASVIHVADAVEAMFSGRPYRSAHTLDSIMQALREGVDKSFSRKPAEALLEILESEKESFLQ